MRLFAASLGFIMQKTLLPFLRATVNVTSHMHARILRYFTKLNTEVLQLSLLIFL